MNPLLLSLYAVTPPGRSRPGTSGFSGHSGFSLAELLFAIGILGVGLIMSAGLFAAGLRQSKSSTDDVLGTIICKNAGAALQARVTKPALDTYLDNNGIYLDGPDGQLHLIDESLAFRNGLLSAGDTLYPRPRYARDEDAPHPPIPLIAYPGTDWQEDWQRNVVSRGTNFPTTDPNVYREIGGDYPLTTRGWLAFARRNGSDAVNDYTFIIVAYDKRDALHFASAAPVNVTFTTDDDDVTTMTLDDSDDGTFLREGTPVVLPTGRIAIAEAVDPAQGAARLDRNIGNSNNGPVWVIYEAPLDEYDYSGSPPDPADDDRPSPAIKVMTLRTPLRQP